MILDLMQYSLNKEKNAEMETKHQRYKGRVVLRGDIVKDASGSYAETGVKMEDAHKLLKIPKSECPDIWIRRAKSVWSSFGRTIMGKAIWESLIETWMGENSKLGMSFCTSWKRTILICACGWHKIGWKETKSWSDVETTQ